MCEESGGTLLDGLNEWKCPDACESEREKGLDFPCSGAPVCDCGPDMCWNGTECELNQVDKDSWKTVIQESCNSFYDGCNTCNRSDGNNDLIACTERYCEVYEDRD